RREKRSRERHGPASAGARAVDGDVSTQIGARYALPHTLTHTHTHTLTHSRPSLRPGAEFENEYEYEYEYEYESELQGTSTLTLDSSSGVSVRRYEQNRIAVRRPGRAGRRHGQRSGRKISFGQSLVRSRQCRAGL